ncbi:MAG: hypothetical protein IPO50_08520 [Sphingomonadales bacterium]|nr:hypothetical protein [Sphingomonadales bacterium]
MMLARVLQIYPCDINRLGDHSRQLAPTESVPAIRSVDADLLLPDGGASVGDHDLVKPALEAAGANLDFWKMAMRPGKPVMVGQLGEMPPGSPRPATRFPPALQRRSLLCRAIARHAGGDTRAS